MIRVISVVLLLLCLKANSVAQVTGIDFSRLVIGKYYEFVLTNDLTYIGKLVSIDENTISFQHESKVMKIRKDYIKEVSVSAVSKDYTVPDSGQVSIELKDGSVLIGSITVSDEDTITLKMTSGSLIRVDRDQIVEISYITAKSPMTDPNSSRLFFAPTGRTMKQGDGYFSVAEIFFPMVGYGVTDYISIAGGISLVPFAEGQLYYFNLKVRPVHVKDFDLSTGVFYTSVTADDQGGAGALYLMGTYGNDKNAATFGGGYAFSTENGVSDYPVLIVGGELQMSKSLKLISENWIVTGKNGTVTMSLGVRFFGRHVAGDFALIYNVDVAGESSSGWPFIPWLGISYNF
jgi:hypothetical protein